MRWQPIGPDFVFVPRNRDFRRLSRRNEWGKQCRVSRITPDPTDPRTLYVVMRPWSGGTSAFRTRNDGATWTPIADDLQRRNPDRDVDPSVIAVNPVFPRYVYLATYSDGSLYVSDRRGDPGSWGPRRIVGGPVRALIVDARRATTVEETRLYAATRNGVFLSANNGVDWEMVFDGDVTGFVADLPASGTDHFYIGAWTRGLFHSSDPRRDWTERRAWDNLSTGGAMLPAHSGPTRAEPAGNFQVVSVDLCPRNPDRLYVWLFKTRCDTSGACAEVNAGLWTSGDPRRRWQEIPLPPTTYPRPYQGLTNAIFAVAPNSPGDGLNDILFFGEWPIYRSVDSGRSWVHDSAAFYNDLLAFAFSPPAGGDPARSLPALYNGCDGGIGRSTRAVEPGFRFYPAERAGDNGEGPIEGERGRWANYNHGLQSIAAFFYACDPSIAALSYTGSADTGVAGGTGALGWRWLPSLDCYAVGVARGVDGVKVWANLGSPYATRLFTDRGEYPPPDPASVTLGRGGPGMESRSNHAVARDGTCVAGVRVGGASPAECVVRIGQDGVAARISQDFAPAVVNRVACHPTNPRALYCTTDNRRLWSNGGAADAATTVWTEITGPNPQMISSIAVDTAGGVYALLNRRLDAGGNALPTPLYRVEGGALVAQTCTGAPADGLRGFGPIVADPVRPDTLYAGHDARVFRLRRRDGAWEWEAIADGLPGQWIYDLWLGNIAPAGSPPRVLLRATIPTRGVWECDVTADAADPAVALYLRDNPLDLGWLDRSPGDVANPYDPANPAARLYHYQCADIKLDAVQRGPAPGVAFYQTDPEAVIDPAADPPIDIETADRPMTHALFDLLKDNSQNLPESASAWLHVQVHNRGTDPADDVSVWAIVCPAAAGVPSLDDGRASDDSFWGQFRTDGSIVPNLPGRGRWRSVGPPRRVSGVTAARPRVVSWRWSIPTLASGDRGHYCVVAFLHSRRAPIGETSETNVDRLTPRNRQVGQKNLHVIAAPPSGGGAGMTGGSTTGGAGAGGGTGRMREYIEFHNPDAAPREVTLTFDLRGLPPGVRVLLQTSTLDTVAPLADSIVGARQRVPSPAATQTAVIPPAGPALPPLVRPLALILLPVLRPISAAIDGLAALLRRYLAPVMPWLKPRGPAFTSPLFEALPSALVEIRGVRLAPGGVAYARLSLAVRGEIEAGRDYVFQVQQLVQGKIVGGCQYVLRSPALGEGRLNSIAPPERWEEKLEDEQGRPPVAPWVAPSVAERRRELARRGPRMNGRALPERRAPAAAAMASGSRSRAWTMPTGS